MKQTNMQISVALRFRRMTRKSYGAFNTMHRIINIGTLSSLALACAYTSTVSAQNVAASEPELSLGEPDKELTGVTVTASKTATPLNEARDSSPSSRHVRSPRPLREVSKSC